MRRSGRPAPPFFRRVATLGANGPGLDSRPRTVNAAAAAGRSTQAEGSGSPAGGTGRAGRPRAGCEVLPTPLQDLIMICPNTRDHNLHLCLIHGIYQRRGGRAVAACLHPGPCCRAAARVGPCANLTGGPGACRPCPSAGPAAIQRCILVTRWPDTVTQSCVRPAAAHVITCTQAQPIIAHQQPHDALPSSC